MESIAYMESIAGIKTQLRYRQKNHVIIVGNYADQVLTEAQWKELSEEQEANVMLINYKERHLIDIVGKPYTDVSLTSIVGDMEAEYFSYVERYFEELLKYYSLDTVKCAFVWIGETDRNGQLLEDICRKKGCIFEQAERYDSALVHELIGKLSEQKNAPAQRKRMKIAIAGLMGKYYSGGRYHAWMWAESLAYMGNDVYFITNEEPIFIRDTKEFKNKGTLTLLIRNNFDEGIDGISELDYVFMIPHRTLQKEFYYQIRNLSMITNARLILLNFEAPNWMNYYLNGVMDERLWDQWRETCDNGCMIISTDRESTKFAKEYYITNPQYTIFRECYLALNTMIADKIPLRQKENRIISFIRFTDKHKGIQDILKLFDKAMKGYTFVFIIGANCKDEDVVAFEKQLKDAVINYGISYEILKKISDEEKYEEISRAKYLLFPSYFEGYGIPPVEAMYFNTRCVAYDLPVIHEVCGDGVTYCKYGDPEDMKQQLIKLIKENVEYTHLREKIFNIANFECGAEKLHDILYSALEEDYRSPFAKYLLIDREEV